MFAEQLTNKLAIILTDLRLDHCLEQMLYYIIDSHHHLYERDIDSYSIVVFTS